VFTSVVKTLSNPVYGYCLTFQEQFKKLVSLTGILSCMDVDGISQDMGHLPVKQNTGFKVSSRTLSFACESSSQSAVNCVERIQISCMLLSVHNLFAN
jgi:hypothetical protein